MSHHAQPDYSFFKWDLTSFVVVVVANLTLKQNLTAEDFAQLQIFIYRTMVDQTGLELKAGKRPTEVFAVAQSEQVSEAELLPQLSRAPSQAAESSPSKKVRLFFLQRKWALGSGAQDVPYSQPPSKPIRRKFRPENQATDNQEPSTIASGPASAATVKPHPTVQ
ncbi:RalBP1-associated Eps domain-containing protein 2, partial [Plecturocebus cupreus]